MPNSRRLNLKSRLHADALLLESAYSAIAAALRDGRSITPAAEWLIDNFHLIAEETADVLLRMSPRQWLALPGSRLPAEPEWPRVFVLLRDYFAHTHGEFDAFALSRYLLSYQSTASLEMRELWALYPVARVVLIDELRRLAVRIQGALAARAAADRLADAIAQDYDTSASQPSALPDLSDNRRYRHAFIVQLAHRLQSMRSERSDLVTQLNTRLHAEGMTLDAVIQREHARRSASNLAVRNIMTTLRALGRVNWRDLFESVSPVESKLREAASYRLADRKTRDRYRDCISDLARRTRSPELDIAAKVLRCASDMDVGAWLVGPQRLQLESTLGFLPRPMQRVKRWIVRHARWLYAVEVLLLTSLIVATALFAAFSAHRALGSDLLLFGLLALFPASELALGAINRRWTRLFPPRHLPRLDFSHALPGEYRTLVVIPVILRSDADAHSAARDLQVHALANPGPGILFALLSDWVDSQAAVTDADDAILVAATLAIAGLNALDPGQHAEQRFFLLHRRRQWNAGEQRFMGWERKRGKLAELNALLLGSSSTSFMAPPGATLAVPQQVRFVLTLDADTRMPLGAVIDLVSAAAHPLNRPVFDTKQQRVVAGYAIFQPRITPLLPTTEERSPYRELVCAGSGLDPYAAAVSDLYQDVFGEGIFTGKGLYDVEAFDAALKNRVPENSLLSHDLFEGLFARCALVSDVELFEDFPSHAEVGAARSHRWIRGDWQLLPWILGFRGRLPPLARWKMLDNLRRSLLPPAAVALIVLALSKASATASIWLLLIMLPWLWPALVGALAHCSRGPGRGALATLLRSMLAELVQDFLRAAMMLGLLAQHAWVSLDAIARAITRMVITHRKRLEWTTAAQLKALSKNSLDNFVWSLKSACAVVLIVSAAVWWLDPHGISDVALLLVAWWLTPLLAHLLSRPFGRAREAGAVDSESSAQLRAIAQQTWRYFATFVTAEDNHLPPDNLQIDPAPVIAHRTSPTNCGLYLLSCLAARDFGWIGLIEMIERISATLDSMDSLERFNGHFLNWYDTRSRAALQPKYVSTVDSGNLAAHLLALQQGLLEQARSAIVAQGALRDDARDASADFAAVPTNGRDRDSEALFVNLPLDAHSDLRERWQQWQKTLPSKLSLSALRDQQRSMMIKLQEFAHQCSSETGRQHGQLMIEALESAIDRSSELEAALHRGAARSHDLVMAMQFGFLYDRKKNLFSIGFRIGDQQLDSGYYDLLASEARLASFVAIAKNDVPRGHWMRLGRRLTGSPSKPVLVSWCGSMFEYLMPALVLREPRFSLLDQSNRNAIAAQVQFAASRGLPWGISESAYNARDRDLNYQYMAFGLPSLGLKRGLGAEKVVAPYATALAAMYQPNEAAQNFRSLESLGARREYGYCDSIDFTRRRLPDDVDSVVVGTFMAHHAGMSLIAIDNALHDNVMQRRFHATPMVQAAELLLQERSARFVDAPNLIETEAPLVAVHSETATQERLVRGYASREPITHLLTNRHFSVMLTDAGTGYSRCRNLAVSRWREDATRDSYGTFIYLKDTESGLFWSAGYQPTAVRPDEYEVLFKEERVAISRRDGTLRTKLEIVVATEDDCELRRVTLTNDGEKQRDIEVTSYLELVLTSHQADVAHPAFSNLFISTEFDAQTHTLLAKRRPRSADDVEIYAAHVIATADPLAMHLEYETDRALFLGRGQSHRTPISMARTSALSNTVGSVLDPIFSLRTRVSLAPGESRTVTFATLTAASREQALAIAAKYRHAGIFEHAREAAWTFARADLHHLQSDLEEARLFQMLAGRLLYSSLAMRSPEAVIAANTLSISSLWRLSVSGDRAILLIRMAEADGQGFIRQCLRAQEYLRTRQLFIDVVIMNEQRHSYLQTTQESIEHCIRDFAGLTTTSTPDARGRVFVLRASALSAEERTLLLACARVVVSTENGNLAEQVERSSVPRNARDATPRPRPNRPADVTAPVPSRGESLEFFNGLGGFASDGREYVVELPPQTQTPAPWINVIANPEFGCMISEQGSSCTWSLNSRENQLTPWSNDPVSDPSGEVLYLFDEHAQTLWSPTPLPIRLTDAHYQIRHGQGYSEFRVSTFGISTRLVIWVDANDPVKIATLRITNHSAVDRRLVVAAYAEWLLGTASGGPSADIVTTVDAQTGALFARNPASRDFGTRVAFCDLGGRQQFTTRKRSEFIARHGDLSNPQGLRTSSQWSGGAGAGPDACAALACTVTILAGESCDVVFTLGQADSEQHARGLIVKYRQQDPAVSLQAVKSGWDELLGAIQIQTPDRALDLLFNRWLLYQTVSCRLWGRAAFYQAGGAYGFRDQLQDVLALAFSRPQITRAHILRAAARQFTEGDVQHWWHPPSGRGVRTHFADDRSWLPFAVSHYLSVSEDVSILDESLPFLEGPAVPGEREDLQFDPQISSQSVSLFEHCARALDISLKIGAHGLPLIQGGDWNDGMNRVGSQGRGESVWLAWFLISNLRKFATLAQTRGDGTRAQNWRTHADHLAEACESQAWDGAWYRRAFFDDGTALGSAANAECRIDSLAQSWAVLSGAADQRRANQAMDSVDQQLVRDGDGLVLIFAPPFNTSTPDPGYVKAYPPGLRENGAQYTHAAIWVLIAETLLGNQQRTEKLLEYLNPVRRTQNRRDTEAYRVEPYVIAADIYSVAPQARRGGWTWYTGAAGWFYRAISESALGITIRGKQVSVKPCLPTTWPSFEMRLRRPGVDYVIQVVRAASGEAIAMTLDGAPCAGDTIPLLEDGRSHVVRSVVS